MRKLVATELPKSSTAVFKSVTDIIKRGWIDVPDEKSFRGTGTQGRLFEHLLDIKENNSDTPDHNGWEIKTHQGGTLITLFHKEPEPKGILNNMVMEHGWKDAQGRTSFRHTIGGESDRGFVVRNEPDRVVLRNRHKDILVPHWTHSTLMNIVGAKFRRLVVVDCEVNKPKKQIRYTGATAYWEFNIGGFCSACETGLIYIDFDARTQIGKGGLRNHGTKFRIKAEDVKHLYQNSKKLT